METTNLEIADNVETTIEEFFKDDFDSLRFVGEVGPVPDPVETVLPAPVVLTAPVVLPGVPTVVDCVVEVFVPDPDVVVPDPEVCPTEFGTDPDPEFPDAAPTFDPVVVTSADAANTAFGFTEIKTSFPSNFGIRTT